MHGIYMLTILPLPNTNQACVKLAFLTDKGSKHRSEITQMLPRVGLVWIKN